jgi:3',5'-cyclic AMP phosphodiesterase CpdA
MKILSDRFSIYEWHEWFAWYPVRTSDTELRWLEIVKRKRISEGNFGWMVYQPLEDRE